MKIYSVLFVSLFALAAQAGGPKRDGFLKNVNDVALVLEYQDGAQTCYTLVGKQKKLGGIFLSPPKMTVNTTSSPTVLKETKVQTSNKKYEAVGTDVSGTAFRIVDKNVVQILFCADVSQVAKASSYLVELELGDKKGLVEVPALN